jgi:hypothetical protein
MHVVIAQIIYVPALAPGGLAAGQPRAEGDVTMHVYISSWQPAFYYYQ